MSVTRRRALCLGIGGLVATGSGCSSLLGGDDHVLTIALANYTDRQNTLQVELLDPGEDTDDAVAAELELSVPAAPAGETAGTTRESTAVPRKQYIVRTLLKFGNWKSDHYHFFPEENSADSSESTVWIGIYEREATGEMYVRFK